MCRAALPAYLNLLRVGADDQDQQAVANGQDDEPSKGCVQALVVGDCPITEVVLCTADRAWVSCRQVRALVERCTAAALEAAMKQMQAPGQLGCPQQPAHSRYRGTMAWQGVSGSLECHSPVRTCQVK